MKEKQKAVLRKKWKSDIIYWDKITYQTASLILSQGELVLKETIETAKTISDKANKLLTILLPIASGILIYLIDTLPLKGLNFLTLTGILIFIVICTSLRYCYKNFKSYIVAIPGVYPKEILCAKFIDPKFNNQQQYLNLVMTVGETIQDAIQNNEDANAGRSKNNQIAIKCLFAILICPLVAFALLLVHRYYF